MHTELFMRHENIIAIRTCANWFKKRWLHDISDKERFRRLATVEEDKLWKDGNKSWKMMENTLINLYCIEVQKLPIFCHFFAIFLLYTNYIKIIIYIIYK